MSTADSVIAVLSLLERLDNGTFERRAFVARMHQCLEGALHSLQLANLLFDLPNLLFRDATNTGAVARGLPAESKQLLYFVERESELLCAFDEPHDSNRILGKFAISGTSPRRLGQ